MQSAMAVGLDQKQLAILKENFAKNKKIESATLYGSRANGNYTKGSDIDIVLKGNSMGMRDLLQISYILDDALFPYKIDLSLYHQIENSDLLAHIQKFGKLIYKRL